MPASANPSSRHRDRTDRRQYQSCDRCRRGRRRCDAGSLDIDPFGRSDLTRSSQNRRRGCSGCQKFNKECTFEWLSSVPRHVLPRRLDLKAKPFEQRSCEQPSFGAVPASTDRLPTHNAQQADYTHTGTNLHYGLDLDLGLDDVPLPEDGFSLAVDYRPGSILHPTLSVRTEDESYFGVAGGFASPKLFDQNCFSRDQFHGVESTRQTGDPAGWIQDNDPHRDSHDDQMLETLWIDETNPSTLFGPGTPIPTIRGIQTTSLAESNALLELDHCQNELQESFSRGSAATSSRWSRTADLQSLTNRFATQHWPTISMQEHKLADKSNKITISNDLMTIYCESLENALECWIDRETCPYRIETDLGLRSPSVSNTLYNRVYRLDSSFSRQRSRPLTRAEDFGSSNALKLAIMAFACQWSHSSRSSSINVHGTTWAVTNEDHTIKPRPIFDSEVSNAPDFERLLRLSVWHESQRCMTRWSYCGSFRVILASIILFCTQQPLDEDEWNDFRDNQPEQYASQDLRAGDSVHSSTGSCADLLQPGGASSRNVTAPVVVSETIPNLIPFTSSFYSNEGLQHVETGLRHLLDWRKSIMSFHLHKQKGTSRMGPTEVPYNGDALPGSQDLSEFNLLFWLGIMCDTTSSVLNRRPLIIPDIETFAMSSGVTRLDTSVDSVTTANSIVSHWKPDLNYDQHPPERTTQLVNIWGSYLLDADRISRGSLTAEGKLPTLQPKSRMLQQGVPLKLLFWRKVGKLQNLIFYCEQNPMSSPTPTEVENTIKEALAVHQYWTLNYGDFFSACIREHSHLSFQSQSWYLVLTLGWNMGCLILARCIDCVDGNAISERLGQSLRSASALTNELRKASTYAIAEAARTSSCLPATSSSSVAEEDVFLAADTNTTKSSHPALIGQSALLWDPHTEKVVKALETACEIFLDWLRQWQSPGAGDCVRHLSWLYTSTNSDEISRHCLSCINALDLLRSKSDVARLTTEHLMVRYNLLDVATR